MSEFCLLLAFAMRWLNNHMKLVLIIVVLLVFQL